MDTDDDGPGHGSRTPGTHPSALKIGSTANPQTGKHPQRVTRVKWISIFLKYEESLSVWERWNFVPCLDISLDIWVGTPQRKFSTSNARIFQSLKTFTVESVSQRPWRRSIAFSKCADAFSSAALRKEIMSDPLCCHRWQTHHFSWAGPGSYVDGQGRNEDGGDGGGVMGASRFTGSGPEQVPKVYPAPRSALRMNG